METNLIRCVNTKTNVVKYLSPAVVNNRYFMEKYKWKREDLPAEQAKPEVKAAVETPKTVAPVEPEVALDEIPEVPPVQVIIDEKKAPAVQEPAKPKTTRAKRGSKKKETTK